MSYMIYRMSWLPELMSICFTAFCGTYNQLSPEIRQGLTGKCQGETWIVTAGAKHLLNHSHFSGDSPRAGLTCSLFTSQPRGCPNRELLLGSAGVGGTSYCPSLLYPARSPCPVAGGAQCWVFVCFLDR